MKTNRFRFIWAAAGLAAGLLVAAIPTAGQRITRHFPVDSAKVKAKEMADALAPQVEQVKKDFDTKRQSLHTVPGPDGKPAFLRKDVANVITQTREELDQAILKVQPSELAPLSAWSANEIAQIQAKLGALPGPKTAAFFSGPSPRSFAVFASLSSPPKHAKPKHASPKPVAPKPIAPPPDTVPTEKTNSLLDEVGVVVSRIFFLASNNDLEVKLWVGSTPTSKATFSFQSQGQIRESTPAPSIIQTNGIKDHVVRGLYGYKGILDRGAVAQTIQYPTPADAPVGQIPSEQLDLVKGTSFFCCQFKEGYCRHVANEKACHS